MTYEFKRNLPLYIITLVLLITTVHYNGFLFRGAIGALLYLCNLMDKESVLAFTEWHLF